MEARPLTNVNIGERALTLIFARLGRSARSQRRTRSSFSPGVNVGEVRKFLTYTYRSYIGHLYCHKTSKCARMRMSECLRYCGIRKQTGQTTKTLKKITRAIRVSLDVFTSFRQKILPLLRKNGWYAPWGERGDSNQTEECLSGATAYFRSSSHEEHSISPEI